MLSRQLTLLNTLQSNFNDVDIKESCCRESVSKIKGGMTNRAFDNFPTLLTEDELAYVMEKFSLIHAQIRRIQKNDDGIHLIDSCDITATKQWIQEIAQKARLELLDPNNLPKREIIQLLEWEDVKDHLTDLDLVYAFVFAVNQSVMVKMNDIIKNNMTPYLAICGHINSNGRAWINEVIKPAAMDKDDITPSNSDSEDEHDRSSYFPEFAQMGIDSPELMAGIGLGSLFIAGFLLFSHHHSRQHRTGPTNHDKPSTPPNQHWK